MKIKINKEKIGMNVLVTSLALSGLFSITAGAAANKMTFKKQTSGKVKIKVIEKSTAKINKEPKLKNIEIEINMPLSVDVKDYIENAKYLDKNMLKKCKLDTSLVNVGEVGTYTYQITYKEKKYNGTVTVKEKEGVLDKLTLKDINIYVGDQLPSDPSSYISESLTDDIKNELKFDTSKVDITKAGQYSYTVSYNNTTYQGRVTVVERKPEQTAQNTSTLNNAEELRKQQETEAKRKAQEEEAKKKAEEDAEKKRQEEINEKENCIKNDTYDYTTGQCINKSGTTNQ